MLEMYLKYPRFTSISCGPFTKTKERIQKFKQTGDTKYIYRNELDKACFQHDRAYKVLARRTASNKVLKDKAFNIAKNPKYDGYQEVLLLWLKNSLTKKPLVVVFLHLQINLLLIMKLNKLNID